jgi:hypothetical protein
VYEVASKILPIGFMPFQVPLPIMLDMPFMPFQPMLLKPA